MEIHHGKHHATYIANLSSGELIFDAARLLALGTAEKVVTEIGRMAYGSEMTDRTRAELLTYLKGAALSAARIRETFALALSASSFQWY